MAAAAASAGLMFWISHGEDRSLMAAPATPTAEAPRYAAARADAGQVVRAFDQLQDTYAEQGLPGVINFARACANQLKTDPGVLDFCVAFDTYAQGLDAEDEAGRAWQADTDSRDLTLARQVLPPDADAGQRLAQIHLLARQASLSAPETEIAAPAPTPAPVAATRARPVAVRAPPPVPCRARATPVQRAVCASPSLRQADRRMRAAYRRALAAGVSPRRLARDQVRWRAALNAAPASRPALNRLYLRRTRQLEVQARRASSAR